MSEPLLVPNGLSIGIANGSAALDRCSLTLSPGETVSLLGAPNGGAEALLRAASGLRSPGERYNGSLQINGTPLESSRAARYRKRVACWPSPSIVLSPYASAILQFSRVVARKSGSSRPNAHIEFELVLERLAPAIPISQFDRSPSALPAETLAWGLLACAVAQKPDVLLADHPLDAIAPLAAGALLAACLEEQKRQSFAFLFASANPALVKRIGGRVIHLRDGRIVEKAIDPASNGRAHGGTNALDEAQNGRPRGAFPRVVNRAEPVLQAYALQPRGAKLSRRDALTFELRRGASLALVGEMGSGPRALLRTFLGLERPAAGRVVFDAVDIGILSSAMRTRLRRKLALVAGDDDVLDPRLTVWDTVAELLRAQLGLSRSMLDTYCESALRRVGLTSLATGRLVAHLSAFDKRRLQVARAMAGAPLLAILDEPWRGLDLAAQNTMMNLLRDFRKTEGPAFLVITADFSVAWALAEEAMVFDKGRMVERGLIAELAASPRTAATKRLLEVAHDGLS